MLTRFQVQVNGFKIYCIECFGTDKLSLIHRNTSRAVKMWKQNLSPSVVAIKASSAHKKAAVIFISVLFSFTATVRTVQSCWTSCGYLRQSWDFFFYSKSSIKVFSLIGIIILRHSAWQTEKEDCSRKH